MSLPIKDILNITLRLTITCLVAGFLMGVSFIFTNDAKKQNAYNNEERVSYSLLGYSGDAKKPENLKIHNVYRYVIEDDAVQYIAYLLPSAENEFTLLRISLEGEFVDQKTLQLSPAQSIDAPERERAITSALAPKHVALRYAENIRIVTLDNKLNAYIVNGAYPGFKTHINMMLALSKDYDILGLEILEHEEDPGLGAEIEQDYFRGQFVGLGYERLQELDVARKPIPDEYVKALEKKLADDEAQNVLAKHRNDDIYALTGATVSSRAVCNGVKVIVKRFAFRIQILNKVLQNQKIKTTFSEASSEL
ncbi:MAG: FMN-binding protein [Bradymonadales bacterium]|jgi:electron transport complex protein RnfG